MVAEAHAAQIALSQRGAGRGGSEFRGGDGGEDLEGVGVRRGGVQASGSIDPLAGHVESGVTEEGQALGGMGRGGHAASAQNRGGAGQPYRQPRAASAQKPKKKGAEVRNGSNFV